MKLPVPKTADLALQMLGAAGYEAYLVGGSVRDLLLGQDPKDLDIATDALPREVHAVFSRFRVLDTGAAHGTVTVLFGGEPVEITTFRTDGSYTDARHPDSVQFVRSLGEDLARRDFTINAMALDRQGALQDPFGGEADLRAGILRCVGEPQKRFSEDALRILRALRFAARLGFRPEERTRQALFSSAPLLQRVAKERVRTELLGLLTAPHAGAVLTAFFPVLCAVLPELSPMQNFPQHNRYHHLPLLEHTAAAVDAAPAEETLRLAAFLHDCGKPACFQMGEDGQGHFYGHAAESAKLAELLLRRLRCPKQQIARVCTLIARHADTLSTREASLRRCIGRLGEEAFFRLLALKRADDSAKNPEKVPQLLAALDAAEQKARSILAEGPLPTLQTLALRGDDLAALGFSGREIGSTLQNLLVRVLSGGLPNQREVLLREAKRLAAKR